MRSHVDFRTRELQEDRRIVLDDDEDDVVVMDVRKKASVKDRIDWSDKVEVVEEEDEPAQTYLEGEEGLEELLDRNYYQKLKRPRLGMVADLVEREKRFPIENQTSRRLL